MMFAREKSPSHLFRKLLPQRRWRGISCPAHPSPGLVILAEIIVLIQNRRVGRRSKDVEQQGNLVLLDQAPNLLHRFGWAISIIVGDKVDLVAGGPALESLSQDAQPVSRSRRPVLLSVVVISLFLDRLSVLMQRNASTDSSSGRHLMDIEPAPAVTASRLYECPDCGQMQVLPPLPPGARAVCLRCDAVLRHTRRDPLLLPLALNISALILFVLGATLTLMSVTTAGQQRVADLVTGPVELRAVWAVGNFRRRSGHHRCRAAGPGALHAHGAARAAPGAPPTRLRAIYAWVEHLRPWSMVEIYLLGLFVAYVRLSGWPPSTWVRPSSRWAG